MTITDVLKFRSTAWGQSSEARDQFFVSLRTIAEDTSKRESPQQYIQAEMEKVLAKSSEVATERKILKWKLKCDAGAGLLTGGASIGSAIFGSTASLSAGLGDAALILAAGGIWTLNKLRITIPELERVRADEMKLSKSAFYNVIKNYEKLLKDG